MRKMKVALQDPARMVPASSKSQPEEVLIDLRESLRLQADQAD
jgi:hypothetical protein